MFPFQLISGPLGKGCQNGGHCVRLSVRLQTWPLLSKALQPSAMLWHSAPPPARSLGPNPSIILLREKMGEEAVIKDWGNFAGISSSSSELKLRNFTCKPDSYRKLPGTSKSFLFLLLILHFCCWKFFFNLQLRFYFLFSYTYWNSAWFFFFASSNFLDSFITNLLPTMIVCI